VCVKKGEGKSQTPERVSIIKRVIIKELKEPLLHFLAEELRNVRSRLPKLAEFVRSRACFTANISESTVSRFALILKVQIKWTFALML